MDISNVVRRIEYTINSRSFIHDIEENDFFEDNKLTIYLKHVFYSRDHLIVKDGEEFEIDLIEVQITYKIEFDFDSIDIVRNECSYFVHEDLMQVMILSMTNHEDLQDLIEDQIAEDIQYDRNSIIRSMSFKPILEKLE